MTGPRLRPMQIGDIFDEGFDLYKRSFAPLTLIAALTIAPQQLITAWITAQNPSTGQALKTSLEMILREPWSFDWLNALSALLPVALVGVFGSALLAVALILGASARYLETPFTVGMVYRTVGRRIVPLVVTSLFYTLGLCVSYILCFFPIVFTSVLWIFTAHTFAIERKAYIGAIRRSFALVSGDGSRVFGALLMLFLLTSILQLAVSYPIGAAAGLLVNSLPGTSHLPANIDAITSMGQKQSMADLLSEGIGQVLVAPFLICVLTVLYYDLRVRKEAFDVEILAAQLNYPEFKDLPPHLPPVSPLPLGLGAPANRRGSRGARR